jgi:selenide,water dikinase
MLFGYAVTGTVHPKKIWRNVGARPGDVLIFTKPIGTGVITTALKKNQASSQSLTAAVNAMTMLNRSSAAAFSELADHAIKPSTETLPAIHAVTDVTGFGALGHAREMALGNESDGIEQTSFEIYHAAFAYFPGAIEAARDGHLSGGLKNNRAFVAECAEFAADVPQEFRDLLFDPQTSGGLLAAIAPQFAAECIHVLARHGVEGRQVGRVIPRRSPLIFVN